MLETLNMKSIALNTEVKLNVISPHDGNIHSLMVLLHDNMNPLSVAELFNAIPKEFNLQDLCDTFHVLIVIPLMQNRYYISTEGYNCAEYVSYELLGYMKERYDLPKSVDAVLAGVSMGGFGATLIAAQTGVFQKVISISGAFIANDVGIGNPEVWGGLTPQNEGVKNTFLSYFLPLNSLKESTDRNAIAAIRLFRKRNERPKFVVAVGTEDWLYKRNLDLLKVLDDMDINYMFDPIDGGKHNAECFKVGIWNAMEYFCNLDKMDYE